MEGKDDQSKTMPIPTGNKKDEIKTLPGTVLSKVTPQNVGGEILGSKNILQDKKDTLQNKESVLEKKDSYEVRTMQHDIDEAKGKKLKSVNIAREAPENSVKRSILAKGGAMSTFENSKLTRQDVEEGVIGRTDESIKIRKTKISFLTKIKNFLFRRKMEQENKPRKTGLVVVLILLVFIGGAGYYLYTSGTFSSLGDILQDLIKGEAPQPTPTSTLPVATTTAPPIPPDNTSSTSTLPIISTTTLDFVKSEPFFSPEEEEIIYIDKLDDLYTGIQESYYKDLGSGKFRRIVIAGKNDFSNLSSSVNLGQIWKSVKALALGGDKYSELVSAEVIDNLGLAMPTSVYRNISEKYNIFFYGQPDDNSSRVVLVFKLNSLDGAEQSMLSWESTILYDLKNIFLGKEHGIQSTDTFQDNNYKNTHIRYLNLPEPNLTMDYTIFTAGEYLVLTTSREAAWATTDKLLGNETSGIENNLDISTWKTYQNDIYKFEVKYPSDWQLISGVTSSPYIVGFSKNDDDQPKVIVPRIQDEWDPASYEIRIKIYDNSNVLQNPYSDMKDVKIAGTEGSQWEEASAPSSGSATITEVGYNNKFYNISYLANANKDTHKKFINVYEKILTTFKFTE